MIIFNSPDHVKERANVVPLNAEDMRNAGVVLNTLIKNATYNPFDFEIELLQRLIFEYENLKHLEAYTKQWNDANNPPNDDRQILVWVEHKNNRLWSTYKIGSYQKESKKYYANGGLKPGIEIITNWAELPTQLK